MKEFANKRVLLIAPQPFYTDRGTPIAVKYVLEALSELGATVDLLTLPMGDHVEIQNVQIYRVMNPFRIDTIPVGFSVGKLLFDAMLFWKAFFMLRRHSYHCIHGVEEAVFLALVARGRSHIPVIYDMASSLPEHLGQKYPFKLKAIRDFIASAERWALSRAAVIICSAGLGDRVRKISPESRILDWRFPAVSTATTAEKLIELRNELGIPHESRIVFYCGNFAEYQGIGLLFKAMPLVMEEIPDLYFVCVGASDSNEIEAGYSMINNKFHDRVRLIGRQPRDCIKKYIALADVLVSPRSSLGNFPLKVFDYLGSGKPIVATDVPAHRCVLNERLALLVKPTPDGIADGVVKVLEDSDVRTSLISSGMDFSHRELSWDSFVSLISKIYENALRTTNTDGGDVLDSADIRDG